MGLMEVMNTYHYGRNDSDEPAELISFYCGVEGTPHTERKLI